VLGYWLLRRRQRPTPLPDATAKALETLKQRGADLSKPATVIYRLSFATREAAEAAGRELSPSWATEIKELPGHRWACKATTRMIPAPTELSTQAQELEALAMRHGGEYESWEVEV
jgi:hypothetical protein